MEGMKVEHLNYGSMREPGGSYEPLGSHLHLVVPLLAKQSRMVDQTGFCDRFSNQ